MTQSKICMGGVRGALVCILTMETTETAKNSAFSKFALNLPLLICNFFVQNVFNGWNPADSDISIMHDVVLEIINKPYIPE